LRIPHRRRGEEEGEPPHSVHAQLVELEETVLMKMSTPTMYKVSRNDGSYWKCRR
jgi:hypothetical protein